MSYYGIDPQLQDTDPGRDDQPLHALGRDQSQVATYASTYSSPQTHVAQHTNQSVPGQSPHGSEDVKKARACEACRGLKVRCDQDPANPDLPCRRCAKAGRQCVYTQPTRKRQKKSENRVTDLEKKLDALTAVLHAQQQYSQNPTQSGIAPTPPRYAASVAQQHATPDAIEPPGKRRRTEDAAGPRHASYGGPTSNIHAAQNDRTSTHRFDTLDKETSDRLMMTGLRREMYPIAPEEIVTKIYDLVEHSLHDRILDKFINQCNIHLPIVAVSAGTSAREVLHNKPLLFLAMCIAAGQTIIPNESFTRLKQEHLELIIDSVMRRNIKSLELVQAILVTSLFWKPPDQREHYNFYMLLHMAALMALDLGMGKRFVAAKARRGFGGPARELPPGPITALVDGDSLEARRAWLGCYYTATSASISLRRPNLIRWSNYMDECLQVLSTSPDAAEMDEYLCYLVRLQRISEEISVSFKMDDPSATAISISDPKVSYTLDIFESKLNDWEKSVSVKYKDSRTLRFAKESAILYLHEIALHVNHNVDDFQLPFTEETLRSVATNPEVLTQRQMAALEACLHSAHHVIQTYSGLGSEVVETLPTMFFFVRAMYALIVLIKMHMAVIAPGSEVAKIIKPEHVRVSDHIEMLWTMFEDLTTFTGRQQGKVRRILGILRDWFHTHKNGDPATTVKESSSQATQTATMRQTPYGRNLLGSESNSKLAVLSEAATAGERQHNTHQQHARSQAGRSPHEPWTFEPSLPGREGSISGTSGHLVDASPTAGNTSVPTPRTSSVASRSGTGSNIPTNNDVTQPFRKQMPFGQAFDDFFSPSGMENLDWTAGMDLDQVLDGAFRDIDTSGDLGGWFFGDGVGAYQLPAEGAPAAAVVGNGRNGGGDS